MPFFGGGPLQSLIGGANQPGQVPGGFQAPNPYMSPGASPIPGMIQPPTPNVPVPMMGPNNTMGQLGGQMQTINPSVISHLGQGGQQGQWNLTPLQKILALLGSYGVGSLLAGGSRHAMPLIGPSAGMNMWH